MSTENIKVRKYLESSIRVSRLINSERKQKKFIWLLEEGAASTKKKYCLNEPRLDNLQKRIILSEG